MTSELDNATNTVQAEWGFVYQGEVLISAVDEQGKYQVEKLGVGDIWYFPKGQAHAVQGLSEENEFLLAFDDGDFNAVGYASATNFALPHSIILGQEHETNILYRVTFNIADWVAHTPKDVLAKNFGVDESIFDSIPTKSPNILNGTVSQDLSINGPNGQLTGNASNVYRTFQHESESAPGHGGKLWKIDSTNFPISKTIAATYVVLKPGGLRELHWHPNVRLTTSSSLTTEHDC